MLNAQEFLAKESLDKHEVAALLSELVLFRRTTVFLSAHIATTLESLSASADKTMVLRYTRACIRTADLLSENTCCTWYSDDLQPLQSRLLAAAACHESDPAKHISSLLAEFHAHGLGCQAPKQLS